MKKTMIIISAVLLLCTGCAMNKTDLFNDPGSKAYAGTLRELEPELLPEGFTKGSNTFGFDAAALLYNSEENLALSPASLELALLMTRAGAIDNTAAEMAAALGMSGLSDDEILDACAQLMWRANNDGMEAANSIWMKQGYGFNLDYIDICTGDFMADAAEVDFADTKTTDRINEWASDKTHGRIDKMNEQPLPADTVMVLVNALYFLGEWVDPFDANDTWEEKFETPSGPVDVDMMHAERYVPYYSGDGYSMISLPFQSEAGDGNGFAMAFLLPAEESGVPELLGSLDGEGFSSALAGFGQQTVKIKLPKFEYKFGTSFADTLKALGMQDAFSGAARFDNMTGEPNGLYIDDVLHKCYIRVDELGAEAAAVTEVVMQETAMEPQDYPEFYLDRPFVFAIYSQLDGTILFLGAVNNPATEE